MDAQIDPLHHFRIWLAPSSHDVLVDLHGKLFPKWRNPNRLFVDAVHHEQCEYLLNLRHGTDLLLQLFADTMLLVVLMILMILVALMVLLFLHKAVVYHTKFYMPNRICWFGHRKRYQTNTPRYVFFHYHNAKISHNPTDVERYLLHRNRIEMIPWYVALMVIFAIDSRCQRSHRSNRINVIFIRKNLKNLPLIDSIPQSNTHHVSIITIDNCQKEQKNWEICFTFLSQHSRLIFFSFNVNEILQFPIRFVCRLIEGDFVEINRSNVSFCKELIECSSEQWPLRLSSW